MKHVSLTTDIWTYELTSRSYLGLTVHYYNADLYKTESNILAVEPLSESHTADHINDIIQILLDEWDIPDNKISMLQQITTDCDKSII